MPMTAYKLLNYIVRLAEGSSTIESVNWRGFQRAGDCLDEADPPPMGQCIGCQCRIFSQRRFGYAQPCLFK